jgi:hypothetical protein
VHGALTVAVASVLAAAVPAESSAQAGARPWRAAGARAAAGRAPPGARAVRPGAVRPGAEPFRRRPLRRRASPRSASRTFPRFGCRASPRPASRQGRLRSPLGGHPPARDRLERCCRACGRAGRAGCRTGTGRILARVPWSGRRRREHGRLSTCGNPARPQGVVGTGFGTRRRLVRALRGCIDAMPQHQDRLPTLRDGVGDAQPPPRARGGRDAHPLPRPGRACAAPGSAGIGARRACRRVRRGWRAEVPPRCRAIPRQGRARSHRISPPPRPRPTP